MTKLKTIKAISWNLLLIFTGSVVCAVAIKGILIPRQFLAGGVTGLSMLVHYVLPFLPVGMVYFLLNIPVFIIGWMFVGRRFFFYSLAGMTIFSAVMLWPYPVFPIKDMFLNALTAGIISGTGSGIILRSLGSAGGSDIISVIMARRFSIRPGTTALVSNGLLLLAAAFRIPLEMVLYTLIYLYAAAQFMDFVVVGLSQRKQVMIISEHWQEISREIMDLLHRGVTIMHGQGAYTGKQERILYVVITYRELSRFKQIIRRIDPQAFVVVSETMEVMGKGVGNQPHW